MPGETFGEEELICKSEKRMTSVYCKTNSGMVLQFTKKTFNEKIFEKKKSRRLIIE